MADMPQLRNIANDTPADATDVEWNFNTVETHVDTQLINIDGTVAMAAPLTLVGGNPTNDTDAANKAYVDSVLPPGVIMDFGAATPPAGMVGAWLVCDGAIYTSIDYADLYGVIGGTFDEPGDSFGGNQFRVPNLKQRVSVGYDAVGAPFDTIGSKGGTAATELITHTHVQDQHTHTQADHLHGDGTYAVDLDHGHNDTFDTATENSHEHVDGVGGGFVMSGTGGATQYDVPIGPGYNFSEAQTTGGSQDPHKHTITGAVTALNVANKAIVGSSASTTATNNNTTPTNQDAGTATADAVGNYPPYITLNRVIKT